jgi:hypothetical protein
VVDPRFCFRLSPHAQTNTWSESLGQQTSRAIYIHQKNDTTGSPTLSSSINSASPSSSSSFPSSSTAATAATVQPNSAQSTSNTPISTKTPSSDLSTGAKAGIGVGASLGGLSLLILGFLLARRCYRSPSSSLSQEHLNSPNQSNNGSVASPGYPHPMSQNQHHQLAQYNVRHFPSYSPPPPPLPPGYNYGYPCSDTATLPPGSSGWGSVPLTAIEVKGPPGGQALGPSLAPDNQVHEAEGREVSEMNGSKPGTAF